MKTCQVIDAIREAISKHAGPERELLEELLSESDGWKMRLDELEDEE